MHRNPNETNFRCCFGILSRDHGAFNYLYRLIITDCTLSEYCNCLASFSLKITARCDSRWSLRHMLTELLVVGLLIYLALQDYFIGIWCTIAAAISLFGMFYHIYPALLWCEWIVKTIFHSCNSNSYIYRCIYSHLLLFKCYGLESKFRDSDYCLCDKSCARKLYHSVLHESVFHGERFGTNSWYGSNSCQNLSACLHYIEYLLSITFLSSVSEKSLDGQLEGSWWQFPCESGSGQQKLQWPRGELISDKMLEYFHSHSISISLYLGVVYVVTS